MWTIISEGHLPDAFVVCSQNDEDVRIWHALRDVEKPFYVEVGAQHPFLLSPTAALYQLGWHGILIEPDPVYAALLREHRPNDTVIEAGASSEAGELVLSRFESTGLSSFASDYVALAADRGMDPSATAMVPVRPLDEILTSEGVSTVHFLSIDVEGWEHAVLLGANLAKWRPWVLCVEAIEPGGDKYVGETIREFVETEGYVHAVFDGVNDWFVAADHLDMVSAIQMGFSAIDSGKYGWKRQETWAMEQERSRFEAQLSEAAVQLEGIALERRYLEAQASEASARFESLDAEGTLGRRYLEAKRELVARSRTLDVSEPVPADTGPDAWSDSASGTAIEPAGRLRHVLFRKSTITRVVRALVPMSLRKLRNERNRFRRSILNHSAPSFVPGRRNSALTATPAATLLGSAVPEDILAPGLIDEGTAAEIERFLVVHPEDLDDQLVSRMDGFGDQTGSILSDLRTRLDLFGGPDGVQSRAGSIVLFDARSLQVPAFRDRGIGVFAKALLDAVGGSVDESEIVLFVDPFESPLPEELCGTLKQISSLNNWDMATFKLLVQPSPMTGDVAPLLKILRSGTPSVVVVYDFIPAEFPDVYLPTSGSRLRYATQVQALSRYSTFLPISSSVEKKLHSWVPSAVGRSIPSWPSDLFAPASRSAAKQVSKDDQIVIFGANEPRKNTFAALVGIEKATRRKKVKPRVVIFGMGAHEDLARSWVDNAQFSNSDVFVATHLPKHERDAILASSKIVIVPSFAEGLSLPVIEALNAGTAVVASRIDAHLELLGDGAHLAHPARPEAWAKAVAKGLARPSRSFAKQARWFARQRKQELGAVMNGILEGLDGSQSHATELVDKKKSRNARQGTLPSIGIATPWPTQRSGVADYSMETLTALSRIADLTLYVTSSVQRDPRWKMRPLSDAFDAFDSHDSFLSVLGNSPFHIPMMSLLQRTGGAALAHDSKMVEFYAFRDGHHAVDNLMNGSVNAQGQRHSFAEQVDGNRYHNLGFAELAETSSTLIFHSSGAAERVRQETGKQAHVLPFVPLRKPIGDESLASRRKAARRYLGFEDNTIHLICVGIIDSRTKLHDLILEAALWLRTWGHGVQLHFVGSDGGSTAVSHPLVERSREGGEDWFHITGHVSEALLDHYLSAADIAIQLRTGDVPMLSAPVADAAAYGTPTIASALLTEDEALPSFVRTLDGSPSPLILAEQLAQMILNPRAPEDLDVERHSYLSLRNSEQYAKALLAMLQELS